jgi:hypothetical protein
MLAQEYQGQGGLAAQADKTQYLNQDLRVKLGETDLKFVANQNALEVENNDSNGLFDVQVDEDHQLLIND